MRKVSQVGTDKPPGPCSGATISAGEVLWMPPQKPAGASLSGSSCALAVTWVARNRLIGGRWARGTLCARVVALAEGGRVGGWQ